MLRQRARGSDAARHDDAVPTAGEHARPSVKPWPLASSDWWRWTLSALAGALAVLVRGSDRLRRAPALQDAPHVPVGKRHTLVLDLDETLVHTFARKPRWLSAVGPLLGDVRCERAVVALEGRFAAIHVATRPYVSAFLREATALFDVVVFTAAERGYADPVIDMLERDAGGDVHLRRRFYRDACRAPRCPGGALRKDVRIFQADLARVAVVDNCRSGFELTPHNGVPVSSWTGNPLDRNLCNLLPLLRRLAAAKDVRTVLAAS